jgi:hypothetical protein
MLSAAPGQVMLHLKAKIDYVPPSPNRLLHAHWKKVYDAKKVMAGYLLSQVGWNPSQIPERVKLTIIQHRERELDRDNLWGSVKGLVDGLVSLRWAKDDKKKNMELIVDQTRCAKGENPWTDIEIEGL